MYVCMSVRLSFCPSFHICSSMCCLIRLLPQLGCHDKIEIPSHKENQISLSLLKIVSILLLVSNFCLLRIIRTENGFDMVFGTGFRKYSKNQKKQSPWLFCQNLSSFPIPAFNLDFPPLFRWKMGLSGLISTLGFASCGNMPLKSHFPTQYAWK